MELTSARLRLRPFALSDGEGYGELLSDPLTHPYVIEGGPLPASEVPARIRAIQASASSTYWALELEGEFVGYLALHGVPSGSPALSYAVRSAWRRRGLALEAIRAICEAFPLKGFVARTHVNNVASARLLERAGFAASGPVETEHGPRQEFRRPATEA